MKLCPTPRISPSHPSELWTAGAQNRSCVRPVRERDGPKLSRTRERRAQISRTHVRRPRVSRPTTLRRCKCMRALSRCLYVRGCTSRETFVSFHASPSFTAQRWNRPSISPSLHVQNIGHLFPPLTPRSSARADVEEALQYRREAGKSAILCAI